MNHSKQCSTHPKKDLQFYCRRCKYTICETCKHESHRGHALVTIEYIEHLSYSLKKQIKDSLWSVTCNYKKDLQSYENNEIKNIEIKLKEYNETVVNLNIENILELAENSTILHFDKQLRKLFLAECSDGVSGTSTLDSEIAASLQNVLDEESYKLKPR